MKKIIKIVIFVLLIYFVFSIYQYNKMIEKSASKDNKTIIFEIKSGESVDEIVDNLFEKNLLVSKKYFKKYLKKEDLGSSLQAGTYSLSPILSIKEIARIFANGETLNKEKTIKLIEGWNIKDMNDYFIKNNVTNDFLNVSKKDIKTAREDLGDFSFFDLLPQDVGLEGFLFPDTYRIFNSASASDIVKKMLKNFDDKLTPEMRQEIKRQGRSLYEVVILASVVEKEVRSEEDMKLVAGLFLNRLESGQALESCATLAYILGVNKKQYTLEDTQTPSPYNTYRNPGLPPGPICNPGIKAIEAAIYPTESDYNYFLSSFEDGETIFSKTYEEHLRNKERFLR